jgi:uridine kinase
MKICFAICGLPRSIDLVIKKIEDVFKNYTIYFYICLTNNYADYEKEYINPFNINNLINNKNILKLLFVNDCEESLYRNTLNYINKINNLLSLVEDKYDIYILIRSDFIFNSIKFLEKIQNDNKLYLCNNNNNNRFINNINERYNDNIIITKNYNNFIKLKMLYNIANTENNYLEIILYNYIKNNNIEYTQIDIDYKLVLSNCNIIAIAGDSGSGKSTLLNELSLLFNNNYVKLETDRYHKWERNDPNYLEYSHLNPYANNLDKMNNDIFTLKIGHEIHTVDYDHKTGKFTKEEIIDSNKNIILCGLHTLYNNINNIINLKIFMDTDRDLITKWKIKRDVIERGYKMEEVLNQIIARHNDYKKYIEIQKMNADIIVNFIDINNILICNVYIVDKNLINKIIISKKFNINIISENNILIRLVDNYYEEIRNIVLVIIS